VIKKNDEKKPDREGSGGEEEHEFQVDEHMIQWVIKWNYFLPGVYYENLT